MQLAEQVARLADLAEELAQANRRREREQQAQRLRERWGEEIPRLGLAGYLNAIPGLAAKFDRVVPPEFFAQTAEHEYEVACPCGQTPVVRPGRLRGCDCGRWFLHDGRDIHVALSPGSPAPTLPSGSGEPNPTQ